MKTKNLAAIVVAMIVLNSCHKEAGIGFGTTPPALRQLFTQNRTNATQSFTVNSTTGGTIVGAEGTRITFPPNVFRDHSGSVVNGIATIELVEALHVGDMVWLNMQTVGTDNNTRRMLQSGGEIRIRSLINGQQVHVADGAIIQMPTNQPDPAMRQFVGTENGDGDVAWLERDTLSDDILPVDTNSIPTPFYDGPWPAPGGTWPPFDFINCDHYPPVNAPSTDVTVNLPSGYDHFNSSVFIVLPGINCMVYMELGAQNTSTFRAGCPVLIGQQATVVVLTDVNGAYFSSFTPVTIVNGENLSVTMQPTTLDAYHTACNAL